MSMIADRTAKTPYLVVRRLRSITPTKIAANRAHSMEWIAQAADLITAMAEDRRRLVTIISNRDRRRKARMSAPKEGVKLLVFADEQITPRRVGSVVPLGDPRTMAVMIAELIDGPTDLYRSKSGGVRVVKGGQSAPGEFLGRFDEGATIQDLREAIE